jgi:hypothetical protein
LLRQYRIDDRVNSNRGPGEDVVRLALSYQDAAEDVRWRFAADDCGRIVYPATVLEVLADGRLRLEYDDGVDDAGELHVVGQGVELGVCVVPRVQMPWHPRCLQGTFMILLRRNMGRGVVLEGLQARWGYTSNLMQALTKLDRWRVGGSVVGPMRKWCDPRLFDVLSESEVLSQYAPQRCRGELVDSERGQSLRDAGEEVEIVQDVRAPEEFERGGFDLRILSSGGGCGEDGGGLDEDVGAERVDVDLFR